MSKSIVAVFAHPDDEVLGCGGSLAKHVDAGDDVHVLILGTGLSSRSKDYVVSTSDYAKLKSCCVNALAALGVKQVEFESFPDNRFDTVALLDIIQSIERFSKNIQADVVYTHSLKDLNIDHQITAQAVMTAFRPLLQKKSIKVFSCEVNSASEWGALLYGAFQPHHFEDVSRQIERKIAAMQAYESEICLWPHPRSEKGILTLAQYRGMQGGMEYAESFRILYSRGK